MQKFFEILFSSTSTRFLKNVSIRNAVKIQYSREVFLRVKTIRK